MTGVPDTSHFARVMVAADYRMKRLAMELRAGPDPRSAELPGDDAGQRPRACSNMLPRWWLAPDYEPILRDADGLAWELRGASRQGA